MDYRDIYYEVVSGSSLVSNIITIALMVLMIVALWKIYEKAGEHGWAAIVPFYRSYVLYKISGKKKLFWGDLVVSIVAVTAYIILVVEIFALIFSGFFNASYMERELKKHGMGLFVCLLLVIACLIAKLVFRIIQCIGLAKNFGVNGGYAVGLIFLPHIFYCIFAFGSNFVYTAGAPKYGNGLYGVPNGFPPQNGGQPPVFINPYSAQPGYGQPLQPNYTVQPGYGQPQQQNYAARPDLQPTGYVNPYVQPQQQGTAGQNGYAQPQQQGTAGQNGYAQLQQPGAAGQTGYTQPEAAMQSGNMQTQISEEQPSGGDQSQS